MFAEVWRLANSPSGLFLSGVLELWTIARNSSFEVGSIWRLSALIVPVIALFDERNSLVNS